MLTAVTSHVRGLPAHSVRPPGLFPSRRVRPTGSLVAGMPADENALKMTSFRAWCLVVLPGACLHTKLWRPRASTMAPHRQVCGSHRLRPSLMPTATRTASSSNLRPQEEIGNANSHLRYEMPLQPKRRHDAK